MREMCDHSHAPAWECSPGRSSVLLIVPALNQPAIPSSIQRTYHPAPTLVQHMAVETRFADRLACTFSFLGFILYVGRSRTGRFVVGSKTEAKRMRKKRKFLGERLRLRSHRP